MEYLNRAAEWKEKADEATRRALLNMTEAELEDSFYTELAFGTAGLRGVIGPGTNRMNAYVVRRATQGLSDYLCSIPGAKERGVAIAYDSRLYSDVFALETALVLAQNGIRAYLFERLHAVPQLSFAVRHYNCIAGVVITASHNPPAYNGYKVYWEHGGQLGPVQADAVLEKIGRVGYFDAAAMKKEEALQKGLLTMIGREVDEAYYAATTTLLLQPELLKARGSELNIVYTPLHGSGNVPVREILKRVGVTNVRVVAEQAEPDPRFPTVSAPNPEDPNAFTLAMKLANETGADCILATDPDADRLGIAVREKNGAFMVLSGNQIGCLLLHYLLSTLHAQGKLPDNALAVKSIVSSRLADAICARFGAAIVDVPTGFRFISEIVDECQRTGERTFLFGFEESYGYLAGGFSRDKDAICAAMLAAELCTAYAAKHMTLNEALDEIYKTYGYYKESVKSYTLSGKAGMEKIAAAMQTLRSSPLFTLGTSKVEAIEDYKARKRQTLATGEQAPLALPTTDMIRLLLHGGAWAVIRPSGTEPKLKLYIGANAPTGPEVDALLKELLSDADEKLSAMLA